MTISGLSCTRAVFESAFTYLSFRRIFVIFDTSGTGRDRMERDMDRQVFIKKYYFRLPWSVKNV